MEDSEIDTVILAPDHAQVRAEAESLTRELAACIDGETVELPSLPEVVLKIREALARDDVDLDRLTELAGADPALAARIMKIANSALFTRGSHPPQNLHSAIVRLGSRMVRNTAIALAAQQVFLGYGSESVHPEIERVWRHSVHVAALSHLLLTVKRTAIPPEDGFLAGLLHEMGRLFILQQTRNLGALWSEPEALEAVIAAWQGRVGARIAEAWDFSAALVAAVRCHDTVSLNCGVPITLTEVVAIANHLAEADESTDDTAALIAGLPGFGAFELEADALAFVIDTARDEVANLLSNLDSDGVRQEQAASSA